ncbi:hypothetical protein KQI52_08805 [bacterium]|nr:hypothetical protein [bacterium]
MTAAMDDSYTQKLQALIGKTRLDLLFILFIASVITVTSASAEFESYEIKSSEFCVLDSVFMNPNIWTDKRSDPSFTTEKQIFDDFHRLTNYEYLGSIEELNEFDRIDFNESVENMRRQNDHIVSRVIWNAEDYFLFSEYDFENNSYTIMPRYENIVYELDKEQDIYAINSNITNAEYANNNQIGLDNIYITLLISNNNNYIYRVYDTEEARKIRSLIDDEQLSMQMVVEFDDHELVYSNLRNSYFYQTLIDQHGLDNADNAYDYNRSIGNKYWKYTYDCILNVNVNVVAMRIINNTSNEIIGYWIDNDKIVTDAYEYDYYIKNSTEKYQQHLKTNMSSLSATAKTSIFYYCGEPISKLELAMLCGYDPNEQFSNNMTPLLMAIEKANISAAELLLANGAYPNFYKYDDTGYVVRTKHPLDYYIDNCFTNKYSQETRVDMLQTLLSNGVDPNNSGQNILLSICQDIFMSFVPSEEYIDDRIELIEIVLATGGSPIHYDTTKWTPRETKRDLLERRAGTLFRTAYDYVIRYDGKQIDDIDARARILEVRQQIVYLFDRYMNLNVRYRNERYGEVEETPIMSISVSPQTLVTLGLDPSIRGVIVLDVVDKDLRKQLKYKKHDIITSINGQKVGTVIEIDTIYRQVPSGSEMTFTVIRPTDELGGEEFVRRVTKE